MSKAKRKTLADQLRRRIVESGLTAYQLSAVSGVHRSQLSRFMRGQRDMGLSIAEKLCAVLGVDLTAPGPSAAAKAAGQPTRDSQTRAAARPKKTSAGKKK